MNGINAIISDSKMADSESSNIWLAPTKAPPNVPALNMLVRLPALMSDSSWLIIA